MIVTTSKLPMNLKTYNKLLQLFQEFRKNKTVTCNEFIEGKLEENVDLSETEIEYFVLLIHHHNFLETIKNEFVQKLQIRHYNDLRIIMVTFLIIFVENLDILLEIKCAFKRKLLQYFCNEDNLIAVALAGCKLYEDDYTLKSIINPLLNKAALLMKIDAKLAKAKEIVPKPLTIPNQINVLQRPKAIPMVPLNTPIEPGFHAQDIPRTLYVPDGIEKRLISEFEKNKIKAAKLLEEAKSLSKNYCKSKSEPIPIMSEKKNYFKAKQPPKFQQNVPIKPNIASVLREGNLCIKEKEKEIRNMEILLKGGGTLAKFHQEEENSRRLEEEKQIEAIERKHLEGQLTFEEAILAKRKLLENNKKRFRIFMEERNQLLEQIEEWKMEEEAKIRKLVQKSQEIARKARESEYKLQQEKHNYVQQIKNENRELLEESLAKKREELLKKSKLIEEIKTLHQIKILEGNNREFDWRESPNFGLLCEMSIAELQEKLGLMKVEMRRELERKRRCIRKFRERQRQMVEDVKNFVAQARMSKPKSLPNRPVKLGRSPELDRLRLQLEHMRQLRKNV